MTSMGKSPWGIVVCPFVSMPVEMRVPWFLKKVTSYTRMYPMIVYDLPVYQSLAAGLQNNLLGFWPLGLLGAADVDQGEQ